MASPTVAMEMIRSSSPALVSAPTSTVARATIYIDGSASDCGLTIHGEDGNDTIIGSNYDDQLFGDAGTDSLVGSDGNDTLYSKDGSGDYVDGGNDSDILYANGGESSVNNVEQTFT